MSQRNLLSFFKKNDEPPSKLQRLEHRKVEEQPPSTSQLPLNEIESTSIERDLGKRRPISAYDVNRRDDIRRMYISLGPYQPKLVENPRTKDGKQNRRFQYSWFSQFPWLEYSEAKDRAFCFPCYLFDNKPSKFPAFTVEGFNSWKRVNNGDKCTFVHHVGCSLSPHNMAMDKWQGLRHPSRHVDKVLNAQSSQEVLANRLRNL